MEKRNSRQNSNSNRECHPSILEDNEIIFHDAKERKKIKYALIKKLRNWGKNNICIYDECQNICNLRSHTIQRASSIKAISENGHTIHPFFHPDKEELSVELIGDNEATTFPGFCETHERLFEDYETKKTLTDQEHFKLQVYRTVCREIVSKQTSINLLKKRLKQYLDHREKRLGELIQEELGVEFLKNNDIKFTDLKYKSQDKRKKLVDHEIKNEKRDLDNYLTS